MADSNRSRALSFSFVFLKTFARLEIAISVRGWSSPIDLLKPLTTRSYISIDLSYSLLLK